MFESGWADAEWAAVDAYVAGAEDASGLAEVMASTHQSPRQDARGHHDIGRHAPDESCNNCRPGGGADHLLMPPKFCPFVNGQHRG